MSGTDGTLEALLATARPRRGRKWLWAGLVAAVLAGGGGWWLTAGSGSSGAVTYGTDPVTRGDLVVTVTATGTVEPTTEVEVSSELSGTLAEVAVTYNDQVQVGQLLARLDDTKLKAQLATSQAQVAAATAQVASAEASLREAAENLTTQAELDKRGVSARSSLTTVQAAHDRAKAALDMARADLTLAKASLDQDRADLAKAEIRSPIEGVVLSREAEAGQIVAASLEAPVLFTIAQDLAQMELLVDIDEADIGKVSVGDTATFTVEAYDAQSFPATITQVRFAPETTDDVVTYKAVLAVDNPDGLLRPGMTATATITVDRAEDVLSVANAALRYAPPAAAKSTSGNGLLGLIMPRPSGSAKATSDGESLWVLRDGQPVQLPITRGQSDGKRTVVQAEGLAEGDLAITEQSGGS